MDDGYSGTNFNRPDFQRLMDDVDAGLVKVIIVKDMSRLDRGYLKVGYSTEIVFPEADVRFIAISDGVDKTAIKAKGTSDPLSYAHHLYVNGQDVTDLHIPDGLTEIKPYAFDGGAFTSITIPESVTSIGAWAFNCWSLSRARFERTDGWEVSIYYDMSNTKAVTVSDPQTAAEYLKNTYSSYDWKRM